MYDKKHLHLLRVATLFKSKIIICYCAFSDKTLIYTKLNWV